ncbi:hypothetical protein [Devosia sp. 1566]|uniref:hypothetical protein n=1 Tax=Devosia sp. 1566 TaxID=2499144 RepID=UPI000FDC03CC|nr:hypothetical protein [Devosia sp. 1566]
MQLFTRTAKARWALARKNAAEMIEIGHTIDEANRHLGAERDYVIWYDQALLDEMALMAFEQGNIVHGILEDLVA